MRRRAKRAFLKHLYRYSKDRKIDTVGGGGKAKRKGEELDSFSPYREEEKICVVNIPSPLPRLSSYPTPTERREP